MNGVILFNAVQEVVSSIKFDNKLEKEIFTNRLYKYVQNDESNANKILKIVSKLIWIRSKEINDFFVSYMKKNYSEDMAFIDFKEKSKSSSTRMISFISGENLCNDRQIIKKSEVTKEALSNFTDLFFIDDYIGSGQTILETLEEMKDMISGKKIHIIAYACQKSGYENIVQYNENISIEVKMFLNAYKDEYEKIELEYINRVCSNCPDSKMAFGYNSTGAYIVLNNIAPNSDISMLWYPSINFNGKRWMQLFDREVSLEILSRKNSELIKKNAMHLRASYKSVSKRYSISYSEYEFLIYSYGCYYTKSQLLDNRYFDNDNDFNNCVNNLIIKKYIMIKKGYIIISDSCLYNDIKGVIESLYKTKQKIQKKVTTNF